jgi:hypothetical protein
VILFGVMCALLVTIGLDECVKGKRFRYAGADNGLILPHYSKNGIEKQWI